MGAQCMSWATSPAATELEQLVMDWVRQMLGLPEDVHRGHSGHRLDRHPRRAAHGARATRRACLTGTQRARGAGNASLTVYASREAHSSVDKAVKLAGYGLQNLRRVPTDALVRDRSRGAGAGHRCGSLGWPEARVRGRLDRHHVVHRVDPVPAVAEICRRHGVWLHVDAASRGNRRDRAGAAGALRGRRPKPTASCSIPISGC